MTFDPSYGDFTQIDFNDPADLRGILHQDKHTRIEGLCSEAVFMEDVIKGNFDPVTTDFWFSLRRGGGYHIRKIVTDPTKPLSDLDYRILDGFAREKLRIPVSIAWFDEAKKTFREFVHRQDQRYDTVTGKGDIMNPYKWPVQVLEKDRDPERLKKACDYLDERGLLKEAAIKRLFANRCLAGGVWDIDAFTRSRIGKVIAFEVKQKFPTQMGTYGINEGQKRLFQYLTGYGMPVVHIILKKPVEDKSIPAVDLLTEERYTCQTEWIYTLFPGKKLKKAKNPAPEETSITGQSELEYSHINSGLFETLKFYKKPAADIRKKLLKGYE